MAVTSIQDQADLLIGRKLVEDKTQGAVNSQIEATSVLESIATNLVLCPRAVLYIAYLARNSLLKAVGDELAQIDALVATVSDLDNVVYEIKDTKSLTQAQTALAQVGSQGFLASSSGNFQKFSAGVEDFLQNQVAKNVRRGSGTMVRPGDEARSSLPADFATVKATHDDVLDRLYSLAVGVKNFSAQILGGLLGTVVAYRVREDIQEIVSELQADPTATNARDYVVRLLTSRAALAALSGAASMDDPVVDSQHGLPPGPKVQARTPAVAAAARTTDGPWSFGTGELFVDVTTDGGTLHSRFPIASEDLQDRAVLVGDAVAWPVTIPPDTHLFISLDGTKYRVALNTGGSPLSMTLDDVITAIRWTFADVGTALEFPKAGSGRLAIVASRSIQALSVATWAQDHDVDQTLHQSSAHDLLGFDETAVAYRDSVAPGVVAGAFQGLFPLTAAAVTSEEQTAGAPGVSGVLLSAPARFQVAAPAVLGLPTGWVAPLASSVTFYGPDADLDPNGLVGPGDQVVVGSASSTITGLQGRQVLLDPPLPVFDGDVVVYSALSVLWDQLGPALVGFLGGWLKTKYAKDLSAIDYAIAPLYGDWAQAKRADALRLLADLRAWLQKLSDLLTQFALPAGAAASERAMVGGIVSTLQERKLDRAQDLLLRCRVREVFLLDWQTASYGGELMSAVSDFVQQNVQYPDRAKDEGMKVTSVREIP